MSNEEFKIFLTLTHYISHTHRKGKVDMVVEPLHDPHQKCRGEILPKKCVLKANLKLLPKR